MVLLELGGVFAVSAAIGAWTTTASAGEDERLVALLEASTNGLNHVITSLVEGGLLINSQSADEAGETALTVAAAAGHAATVSHLLSLGAQPQVARKDGMIAAHVAAARGDMMVLTRLLEVDLGSADAQDALGYTVLHHTCLHGHASITDLLLGVYGSAVDAQATSADGSTPIAVAVSAGSAACVRLLIEHGGCTEAANERGDSPLHLACAGKHLEIASMLCDQGASMLIPNRKGATAVDLAATDESGALSSLLARHHAERLKAGGREANLAHMVRARLLDQLRKISREDPVALHQLSEEKETKALLLRFGVDVKHTYGGRPIDSDAPVTPFVGRGSSHGMHGLTTEGDVGSDATDSMPPTARATQALRQLHTELE